MLTFQLNRFAYDYNLEENIKINDFFEFYEELDMGQFLAEKSPQELYELFAVYVHIGLRGNSGHYKVFIKLEDRWFEFNDEIVEATSFQQIKQSSFGGKTQDYFLDVRNFCVRQRKRDALGHAYRLVYI